jgi:hypothetical protein
MTTPRGTYGGYRASSAFPDTPIYDSLVAERGTPQIAPIRVPSPYDAGSSLPALPVAFPALAPGPSSYNSPQFGTYAGHPQVSQPNAHQYQPAAHLPPQAAPQRGYPAPAAQYQSPAPYPAGNSIGYEAVRPVPPRPVPARQPAPAPYGDDSYRRPYSSPGY